MRAKLDALEIRFSELTHQLADPALVHDVERLCAVSKERADLDPIVAGYQELRKVEEDLAGCEELLRAESDPELLQMAKEDLVELRVQCSALQTQLQIMLLPQDPNDAKDVILEVRAGTGGDEASIFAGDLSRMYMRYAELQGWKVSIFSRSEGTQGGYKEVILSIAGDSVFSRLKYESGVHRVQRVPATESQGRIHTSACTVAVLPEAEQVEVNMKDGELRIDVYRSSGPGGQSVNTTDSAVRITHLPTGLVVTCQDEKSQHKNKAKAMTILASRLLAQTRAAEDAKRAASRKDMVGSGDRSEKIRTYNAPQDRLTDHRIGLTVRGLDNIFQGHIEPILQAVCSHYQAEQLRSRGDE